MSFGFVCFARWNLEEPPSVLAVVLVIYMYEFYATHQAEHPSSIQANLGVVRGVCTFKKYSGCNSSYRTVSLPFYSVHEETAVRSSHHNFLCLGNWLRTQTGKLLLSQKVFAGHQKDATLLRHMATNNRRYPTFVSFHSRSRNPQYVSP